MRSSVNATKTAGNPSETIDIYWEQVLELLRDSLSEPSYSSIIKRLELIFVGSVAENGDSSEEIIIQAPSGVFKSIVESKFVYAINEAFEILLGKKCHTQIVVPGEPAKNVHGDNPLQKNNLKSKYVFETFVRGKSNDLAYAASVAVSNAPGTTYNPLFLYGGVGLGKTHLMHSIGNSILKKNPSAKVLYCSTETFVNELITSIKERKNQEFRNKYRDIDVLLIDDIQFLSDKEGTQEEFFHTFNALYDSNKQIVISSDQPPHAIRTLEDRLRSRFGWGLIVDVKLPDFETRTAILEKKAELDNIKISKEVTKFIAKTIASNIRDLEGALNKVAAYSKLSNTEITLEMADKALKDIVASNEKPKVTVEHIQEVISKYYGISTDDMRSKKRTANIAYPRQIAMYLVRKLLDQSLPRIGEQFGGRDHSTVIHGCDKIADELERDSNVRNTLLELEKIINGDQ